MRQHHRCLLPAVAFAAALATGCSTPNAKLTQIQQDKEQLLVAIREQRDKNQQLQSQVVSLESRLGEAERELARAGGGTRISTKPNQPLPPAQSQPLPWRAPAGKAGDSAAPLRSDHKTIGPALRSAGGSLATLAERDSRVQLDARNGRARLDSPLTFDEHQGTLTAESKRQLDQVAKLLRSEEARELQITIDGAGGTERAQAVADYLDRHGIAHERLQVTGGSGVSPAAMRTNPAGGVQIYLSEADQPLRR